MSRDPLEQVRRAAERAALASRERDAAIRKALETHTMRAVAQAAGLSHQRVHQIQHGR